MTFLLSQKIILIPFADDTNVFFLHTSLHQLNQIVGLNEKLVLVAEWFSANKLTLNLDKTNFVLFNTYKKLSCQSIYQSYLLMIYQLLGSTQPD